MGYFSKEIPLNADTSLGPVTIGSKIRVEGAAEPLPLERGNVEIVPGCGWGPGTVTITNEMNASGNKLNILVKLADEISLAHYAGVILKRKPIKLKVTLYPKISVPAPGMGVPVTVSSTPFTDSVDVKIPVTPSPEIRLKARMSGKSADGTYTLQVTASLDLPPYISVNESEKVIRDLEIGVKAGKHVTVVPGEAFVEGSGKTLELTATPDFKSGNGKVSITVRADATLPGLPLTKTERISLEPPRKYILQKNPGTVKVKKGSPGVFTVALFEKNEDEESIPVPDALIRVKVPPQGAEAITVSPDRGSGTLRCVVTQVKDTQTREIPLALNASAGDDSLPPGDDTHVIVLLGDVPGPLSVEPTRVLLPARVPEKGTDTSVPQSASILFKLDEASWEPVLEGEIAGLLLLEKKAHEYEIRVADDVEIPDPPIGPDAWHRDVTLHSAAIPTGKDRIPGPDVTVRLCFEGLFAREIINSGEDGRTGTPGKEVVIRVDSPEKEDLRHSKIRFVAMTWDGQDVAENAEATAEGMLELGNPECSENSDSRLWNSIFEVLRASLVFKWEADGEEQPEGSRYVRISLDKTIPGKGEEIRGKVTVSSSISPDLLSMDLPFVLRLGKKAAPVPQDIEKERQICKKMIEGCLPKDQRERFWNDLEKLPGKGAGDYRKLSEAIYETAWKIWAEDQKDYQFWDNGWGYYLFKGTEAAKWAGDVSFMLLVGYATAEFGPANAYGASLLMSECKDEGLAFYAYYIEKGGGKSFSTCIVEFVNENLTQFLLAMASGAVDTVILQGIDIKKPATYKRLAWLWLWKIDQHLAREPEKGLMNAMVEAGKEVIEASAYMILQEFVNVHGTAKIRELHTSVKEKGLLGGRVAQGEQEKPPKEGAPEKDRGKKKPGKEKEKTGETTPEETKKPGEKKSDETKKPSKEPPGKDDAVTKKYKERVEDEQKTAKERAERAIEATKDNVQKARQETFEQGRQIGAEKVRTLAEATENLRNNPNDPAARKAFEDAVQAVQQDKHAMHELNAIDPEKPNPVREEFNRANQEKYENTDRAVKERIAAELNKNLKEGQKPYSADEIEPVKITNIKAGQSPPDPGAIDSTKSTYDRDVTYRSTRPGEGDINTRISEPAYHEEFYKEWHNGELPRNPDGTVDSHAVKEFNEHMDQTVTDRYHTDAYGGGRNDIPVAVDPRYRGADFKDVGATAKTMEYKTQEWYDRARNAEKAGDPVAAEAYKEEGIRQLTKQFGNQIEARVNEINRLAGYPDPPKARVPQDVRAAVDILKKVGTKGPDGKYFTPADAEAALKGLGGSGNSTPEQVAHKMSSTIEGLQKLTPPSVREKVDAHVRSLPTTEEWEAAQRAAQKKT